MDNDATPRVSLLLSVFQTVYFIVRVGITECRASTTCRYLLGSGT